MYRGLVRSERVLEARLDGWVEEGRDVGEMFRRPSDDTYDTYILSYHSVALTLNEGS